MPIWTVIRTINTPPGSPLGMHDSILGGEFEAYQAVYRRWLAHPGAAEPTHVQISRGGDQSLMTYRSALARGALLRP